MNIIAAGLFWTLLMAAQHGEPYSLPLWAAAGAIAAADPADAVEKEYRRLMESDDDAHDEIDKWIKDEKKLESGGAGSSAVTMRARIRQRLETVRQGYEDFLQRHPGHVRARIAYGSFLNDAGDEEQAVKQWEKARELDPNLPAVWNNLANHYAENGDVRKAFQFYEKAVQLSPNESTYYHNLAITTYMFRKDAQEHFGLATNQIRDRVMAYYQKALALDPANFELASELAQTYYGFSPEVSEDIEKTVRAEQKHHDEALAAWQNALKLVRNENERQGVLLHLARVNMMAGRLQEARRHLAGVTNAGLETVKARLERNLDNRTIKMLSLPTPSLRPITDKKP